MLHNGQISGYYAKCKSGIWYNDKNIISTFLSIRVSFFEELTKSQMA